MHSGGRHHPPRPAAENPQVARRSAVGDRQRYALRHHTDSSAVFARRAAAVASSVNPPEQRPSVSAATADRRSAQARDLPECEPLPDLTPNRLRALPAGDAGGQFRRQPPVVRCRDRRRVDGDARRAEGPVSTVCAASVGAGVPFSECRRSGNSCGLFTGCRRAACAPVAELRRAMTSEWPTI
jgi:hypothetical protein